MFTKGPLTSSSYLKHVFQKMLLKMFFMSTCIMFQSRCKSRRALMPKMMVSQLLKVKLQTNGGIGAPTNIKMGCSSLA